MDKSIHKRHKHLHPVLSYAFLLGAGVMSLNGALTAAEPSVSVPAPAVVAAVRPAPPPPDLASLKSAAAEFSAQLAIIKAQVAQLVELGYPPPQELADSVGEGEQLTAMISQASSLADMGGINAGARLESIGARIRVNSKY